MIRTIFIITICCFGLVACDDSFKQTPLFEQESALKPDFISQTTQDQIILQFDPYEPELTDNHIKHAEKFINYYKNAKDIAFFVVILKDQLDSAQNLLPDHTKQQYHAFSQVADLVEYHGIIAYHEQEFDTYNNPATLEARAMKAILDTAENHPVPSDEELLRYAPNPQDLERPVKIALRVKQYKVEAANCPRQGTWDWEKNDYTGSHLQLGCAIKRNLIAQVKNKASIVQGLPMDNYYNSAIAIRNLDRQGGSTSSTGRNMMR